MTILQNLQKNLIKKFQLNINKLALVLLISIPFISFAQQQGNKTIGICFRVDDRQDASKWRDWNKLFNKYGYKFSLAINVTGLIDDTACLNALKEVAASGHELMDHTPNHHMGFFTVKKAADTIKYYQNAAIDHINGTKLCLKLDTPITTKYVGEGMVNLIGNQLISVSNGEFATLNGNPNYTLIYLPTKKLVVVYSNLLNKDKTNPDTITLQTYWQENMKFDTVYNIPYERLTSSDIRTMPESNLLLAQRSVELFEECGLPKPITWIQPGGNFALLSKQDVKLFANKVGYSAGAVNIQSAQKMYNEVDTLGDKRFGVQGADFYEENNNFNGLVNIFSDRIARNFHSVGLSHMHNVQGGWTIFLGRVDSVLKWCTDNKIPLRTYNKTASILYDSVASSLVNTFPSLTIDLNRDGKPDGYTVNTVNFDSLDGVEISGFKSFYSSISNTNIASINSLGGLEKGLNKLSMYTKGQTGDSIRIYISFPEITTLPNHQYIMIAANTTDWTKQSKTINIPYNVSRINFGFIVIKRSTSGIIKMSGLDLRSMATKIAKKSVFSKKVCENFKEIKIESVVYENFAQMASLNLNFQNSFHLNIDSSNNNFKIKSKRKFFVGKDSIRISATNNLNLGDSGYIYLISESYKINEGDTLIESLEFDSAANNIQVTSNPLDSFLNYSNNIFKCKPRSNTWYTFNWKNGFNDTELDSFYVEVVAKVVSNPDSNTTVTSEIINNQIEGQISIYPNPANDIINVTSLSNYDIEEVKCYGFNGKELALNKIINGKTCKIDCNGLTKGLYFLRIKVKSGITKTTTFVKQ